METLDKANSREGINQVAIVFKALGHPIRIQLVRLLMENKFLTLEELTVELPLVQSVILKHLLLLKNAEVISITFGGKKSIYALQNSKLTFLSQFFDDFNKKIHVLHKKSVGKENEKYDSTSFISENKFITKKHIHLKKFNYKFNTKKK